MRKSVQLETYKLEGYRYALEPGRRFKVKGVRGEYKVVRLERFQDGAVEALCWWRSGPSGERAEWRTVALEGPHAAAISKILKGR